MKQSILFLISLLMLLSGCNHTQSTANLEHADKILILKSTHTLSLLRDGHIFRSYTVALGRNPVGAKARKGDHKTPEGLYTIAKTGDREPRQWQRRRKNGDAEKAEQQAEIVLP